MTIHAERKIQEIIDSLPEQIKLFGTGEGRSIVRECEATNSISIRYENRYYVSLNRPRPDEIKITEYISGLRHSIFISTDDIKELWVDLDSGDIVDMMKTVCIDDITCRFFSSKLIKSIMVTDKDDRFIKYIILL